MQGLKEKAPVQSGNSDEGNNQKPTKGMIVSNSLTKVDTIAMEGDKWNLTVSQIKQLADVAGVTPEVFWNQRIQPEPPKEHLLTFGFKEPSASEVVYAEQFMEYTVKIVYVKSAAVRQEGEFRFFGGIAVVHSRKEIFIRLFDGATSFDLIKLKHDVQKIREGYWSSFPWQRAIGKNSGVEYFRVNLGDSQPARGDRISPCTEERCEDFGGHHLVDALDPEALPVHNSDLISGDHYYIQLMSEKPGEWIVDTEIHRPLTVTQAASYASDLMWLVAEAKKLNSSGGKSNGVTS
jgi:hypothetical protein